MTQQKIIKNENTLLAQDIIKFVRNNFSINKVIDHQRILKIPLIRMRTTLDNEQSKIAQDYFK